MVLLLVPAILLLFALARRRWLREVFVVGLLMATTGCDGCSPSRTPGPLRPDENTRFHITDRLGSSALVLDLEGNVIARDAHRPYGDPWVAWRAGDARGPDYSFTGEERDPLASAIAIGARQYIPALGRWVSPDPLFVSQPDHLLESPDERNLYRYAANNPTTNVDPTGTSIWTKLAKVGAKLLKGASAAEAFAGNIEDARTLANPRASVADRVIAGVSLASELLPVSVGDARDVAQMTHRALKAAPTRKAIAATSSARSADHRLDAARAARDARAKELGPLRSPARPATVTAGYNTKTGQVATGCSGGGLCAEQRVVEALGGDAADVRFTEAVRPRKHDPPYREVSICTNCESRYGREPFPETATFESDR